MRGALSWTVDILFRRAVKLVILAATWFIESPDDPVNCDILAPIGRVTAALMTSPEAEHRGRCRRLHAWGDSDHACSRRETGAG
jgi:hypothetical protein